MTEAAGSQPSGQATTPPAATGKAGSSPLPDPSTLSYEQAKAELRNIVSALESGSVELEDTLNLWQRGELLATRCKTILDEASALIEAAEVNGGSTNENPQSGPLRQD